MTSPTAADAARLRSFLRDNSDRMLSDVRHLVMIESPSDSTEALGELHAYLVHWVAERLGRAHLVEHHRVQDAATASAWTFEGSEPLRLTGSGDPETFVALLGHYDTVWPLGTTRVWPFARTGDRIDGPGTYDMKVGLVQMVWLVAALRHVGLPHPAVRLLMNGDEEIGSLASRPFLEQQCRAADAALVFEGALGDHVKTARKGIGNFVVDVLGVEAHAGVDPENGASAIHELGSLLPRILGLARPEAGTTLNVGLASGGTRINVTAGHVRLELEARIRERAEAERVESELEALTSSDERIRIEVRGEWQRPVFERTEPVAALYHRAQRLARIAGIPLGETSVGGASDGNLIAALGVPVLDGLGPIGAGAHARDEHTTVSGMLERTVLSAMLVASTHVDARTPVQPAASGPAR